MWPFSRKRGRNPQHEVIVRYSAPGYTVRAWLSVDNAPNQKRIQNEALSFKAALESCLKDNPYTHLRLPGVFLEEMQRRVDGLAAAEITFNVEDGLEAGALLYPDWP